MRTNLQGQIQDFGNGGRGPDNCEVLKLDVLRKINFK